MKARNLFLIIGIVIFIDGSLMEISNILYGFETLIAGILIIGFALSFAAFTKTKVKLTSDYQQTNYPNILQSFGITGILVLATILLIPVNLYLYKLIGREAAMLCYYLLSIGIALGFAFFIRKDKTRLNSFSFALDNKRIIPFITIGSMALFFGISSPIAGLIPIPESMQKTFLAVGSQAGIFAFILMVIAAPVLEELLFRGIILDGLLKGYSPIKSILVSSLLFGIAHQNHLQFAGALTMGIFSGWVYYRTRSLLPSIIIHAAINLSGFIMRSTMNVELSMGQSLVEMYGGWTNLILTILGSIILLLICIYFLKKEFVKLEIKNVSTQVEDTREVGFIV